MIYKVEGFKYIRNDGSVAFDGNALIKMERTEEKKMETINKVKGYRNMVGITQDEMANLLGLKDRRSYLERENGRVKFTINELVTIKSVFNSRGLNLTLEDLISE